jgi:hypothetical protein
MSDRDEKRMVSLNELNLGAKLAAQVAKRADAPAPTQEKQREHLEVVAAPTTAGEINTLATAPPHALSSDVFFDKWAEYYPKIVALLGFIPAWMLPAGTGAVLLMIKSLLAVANNDVLPIVQAIFRADILPMLRELLADKELLAEVRQLIERNRSPVR